MKLINHLFIILFFSSFAYGQEFVKLSNDEINKEKVEFAQKVATEYFEALNKGEYYDFSKIAIPSFSKGMTREVQAKGYIQLKEQFGTFESLSYAGCWVKKGEKDQFEIIRFKSVFTKLKKPMEVRMVLTNDNKVEGLWIMPWVDNLNDN